MRKKVILFIFILRDILPLVVGLLAERLLDLEMQWPLIRAVVFLAVYNSVAFGVHQVVFFARRPPPFRLRVFLPLVGIAVAAAIYLGLPGEVIAIAILGYQTPKIHVASMLHFRTSEKKIVLDAILFTTAMLVAGSVYFGFSLTLLGGAVSYGGYLAHLGTKANARLPSLRRFP